MSVPDVLDRVGRALDDLGDECVRKHFAGPLSLSLYAWDGARPPAHLACHYGAAGVAIATADPRKVRFMASSSSIIPSETGMPTASNNSRVGWDGRGP